MKKQNLALFDQQLALSWTKECGLLLSVDSHPTNNARSNIARFGGDPEKVSRRPYDVYGMLHRAGQITLFGSSAGSASAALLVEHFPENPPFHGAILVSGVNDALDTPDGIASDSVGNFTVWNSIAAHFGCPAANGTLQIDCLKKIPARDLEQ